MNGGVVLAVVLAKNTSRSPLAVRWQGKAVAVTDWKVLLLLLYNF